MFFVVFFDSYSIRLSLPAKDRRGRIYVASDNRPRHLWYVACGMLSVVCGMWYVVCGMRAVMWYAVCGMWYAVCGRRGCDEYDALGSAAEAPQPPTPAPGSAAEAPLPPTPARARTRGPGEAAKYTMHWGSAAEAPQPPTPVQATKSVSNITRIQLLIYYLCKCLAASAADPTPTRLIIRLITLAPIVKLICSIQNSDLS